MVQHELWHSLRRTMSSHDQSVLVKRLTAYCSRPYILDCPRYSTRLKSLVKIFRLLVNLSPHIATFSSKPNLGRILIPHHVLNPTPQYRRPFECLENVTNTILRRRHEISWYHDFPERRCRPLAFYLAGFSAMSWGTFRSAVKWLWRGGGG